MLVRPYPISDGFSNLTRDPKAHHHRCQNLRHHHLMRGKCPFLLTLVSGYYGALVHLFNIYHLGTTFSGVVRYPFRHFLEK